MSTTNASTSSAGNEKTEKTRKRYLFAYNFIQTLGWTCILLRVLRYYISNTDRTLYEEVKYPLIIFQNGAFLEYFHARWGLTKSNPIVTFQQLYSRIYMVCLIILPIESATTNLGFPMLLFAWSIAEIIRYSNYALILIDKIPYPLLWLRYTTFIVLYPIGVTGELLCMLWSAIEIMNTKQWCIEFPNKYNVIFYYYYYIIFNMMLYIPFFPKLYMHMFTLRKKVLGDQTQKAQ